MKIVLIRHASKESDPDPTKDPYLSLTPEGKREICELGNKLASLVLKPTAYLTSRYAHANQTGHLLSAQIGGNPPAAVVPIDALTPHDLSPFTFEEIIRESEYTGHDLRVQETVAFVMHHPRLNQLLAALTSQPVSHVMPKYAEAICLAANSLSDFLEGKGEGCCRIVVSRQILNEETVMPEPLNALVSELQDLAATAAARSEVSGSDLRRVLGFIAKVSQVLEQAFQDVLTVLIDLKYMTVDDLGSGKAKQLQKQVDLLTVKSRYRDAEEICSRLHHLSEQYYEQIAPILDGVTDIQGWADVLGLINEHEGRLIFLVHNTCYELEQKLARLDVDSLKSVTDYAENRLNMVREALNRLRELSNSILGLSGRSGLLELTSSRDTRESIASILINQGSVVMSRDEYKIGQAGAVGLGAHAHDMTFNQIWNESGSKIDTKELANELTQLRSALTKEASDPDHFVALGEVAAAEKAANADDGPTALQHLKKAGSWVWDVGTKVGIGVAIAAAKTVLGI